MQQSQDLICVDNNGASHITVGRLYTTKNLRSNCQVDISDMDDGDVYNTGGGNYTHDRFVSLTCLGIDQLFTLAISLIGLRIKSPSGNTFTIEDWGISNTTERGSTLVRDDVSKNVVSVYLIFSGMEIPLRDLVGHRIIYPSTSKTVYLNGEYNAIVTKTHVTVGCQTFPIEVVESILAASKALS